MALSLGFTLSCASACAEEANRVQVKARVVSQYYCRGDADLFTVDLDLDITVMNVSKEAVFFKKSMIPWVARVAQDVPDAQSGRFMFEISRSHYSDPKHLMPSDAMWVDPGKSVTFQSGYALVVRYDPEFKISDTISAGTYALVLELEPEIQPPNESKSPLEIEKLTTEPFAFEVEKNPHLITCSRKFPKRRAGAER